MTFTNNLATNLSLPAPVNHTLTPSGSDGGTFAGYYDANELETLMWNDLVNDGHLTITEAPHDTPVPETEPMTRELMRFYDQDTGYRGTWDSLVAATDANYMVTKDLAMDATELSLSFASIVETVQDFEAQVPTAPDIARMLVGAEIPDCAVADIVGIGYAGGPAIVVDGTINFWFTDAALSAGPAAESVDVDVLVNGASILVGGAPVTLTGPIAVDVEQNLPVAAGGETIPAGAVIDVQVLNYVAGGAATPITGGHIEMVLIPQTLALASGFVETPVAFTDLTAEANFNVACSAGVTVAETMTIDIWDLTGAASILTAPVVITNADPAGTPVVLAVAPASLPLAAASQLEVRATHTLGDNPNPMDGLIVRLTATMANDQTVPLGTSIAVDWTVPGGDAHAYFSPTGLFDAAETVDIDIWDLTAGASILTTSPTTVAGPLVAGVAAALPVDPAVLPTLAGSVLEVRVTNYVDGGAGTATGMSVVLPMIPDDPAYLEAFHSARAASAVTGIDAWVNASPAVGEEIDIDVLNDGVSILTAPETLTSATAPYTDVPLTVATPALVAGDHLTASFTHQAITAPMTFPTVGVEITTSVPAGTTETVSLGAVSRDGEIVSFLVVAPVVCAAGESITLMLQKSTAGGAPVNLLSAVVTRDDTTAAHVTQSGVMLATGVEDVIATDELLVNLVYTAGATPTPLRDITFVAVLRPSGDA